MLFYFIRHGETEANRQEVLAGSGLDYPLNSTGHLQAEKLAKGIDQLISHPVGRLYASNMQRAQQTAAYVARAVGLPLETVPDFREWHLGEWEGKGYAEYSHLLLEGGEPKTGESRQAFYGRVAAAWREVHSEREPYIVVSHGGVWLALQDILKIPRFAVSNCDVVKVELKDPASSTWMAQKIGP